MEKKTEEERVIPIKNYIILIVLFAAVIALVLYLCQLYNIYDEHQREIPIIRDSLYEIQYDELDHYVMENPTTIIYMCTAADEVCRDFEKDFKKLVEQDELQESVIYLNLSNIKAKDFVETFNNTYSYKRQLKVNYPAFVVFEDGKVKNILQADEDDELSISEVEQFIELNRIEDESE